MLLFLSLLLLAIGLFYLTAKVTDDVLQLAVWLGASFSFILSLVVAPWKSLILFAVLLLISRIFLQPKRLAEDPGSLSIAHK